MASSASATQPTLRQWSRTLMPGCPSSVVFAQHSSWRGSRSIANSRLSRMPLRGPLNLVEALRIGKNSPARKEHANWHTPMTTYRDEDAGVTDPHLAESGIGKRARAPVRPPWQDIARAHGQARCERRLGR